jgi:hypothetical protein
VQKDGGISKEGLHLKILVLGINYCHVIFELIALDENILEDLKTAVP